MEALISLTTFLLFVSSVFAVDPLCEGLPTTGKYLLPYPGDCSRYYVCENGIQRPESCPPGEWFNNRLQSCDHPSTSGCYSIVCPPDIVDFFPNPLDCSEYFECYNGASETHACPPELWFNAQEKRCVNPEQSLCGQYAPPTVVPPWTTPSGDCYGVLPGYVDLKPYPGDCSRYIECIGSLETIMECPPGYYFNDARNMCDLPILSGCDNGNPTPTPPHGDDDPRCANGNNDYWPDPECTKFIECYEGHGYLMDCPSGLYFDASEKLCVDPSVSDCGRTVPTADPWTTTRGSDWTPDPDCPWPSADRYLFPYPGDCTKFLECVTGEKVVQNCPPDLWFNPSLLVCDYPYHSGCIYHH